MDSPGAEPAAANRGICNSSIPIKIKVEEDAVGYSAPAPAVPDAAPSNNDVRGILRNSFEGGGQEGSRQQPDERVCATCRNVKARLDFSPKQWTKCDLAKCKDCVKCKESRLCARCKIEKIHGHYSKAQWKNGKCRQCKLCLQLTQEERVAWQKATGKTAKGDKLGEKLCSICRVVRSRWNFDEVHQNLGDRAKCMGCIRQLQRGMRVVEAKKQANEQKLEPEMRVCARCKAQKSRQGNFSSTQWKKGAGASRCYPCALATIAEKEAMDKARSKEYKEAEAKRMETLTYRLCCVCNSVKAREEYDDRNQQMGMKSKCKQCINANIMEANRKKAAAKTNASVKRPTDQAEGDNLQSKAPKQPKVKADGTPTKSELQQLNGVSSAQPHGVKRKTRTEETELDDGTKITETETVETHPDGTTVKRLKRTLEKTTNLPDGSKSVERTETNSTVKTSMTVIGSPRSG